MQLKSLTSGLIECFKEPSNTYSAKNLLLFTMMQE